LPGYGLSDAPDHKEFEYTFDHLAEIIGDFVEQMGLKKFALYIFDYGAPVGLRVALRFPDRISALISQNGSRSTWSKIGHRPALEDLALKFQ
jgi:pimeloyl-ACP methyl ester carboxylesterase